MKIDKSTMVFGAGAAVGVSQTVIFREYVDSTFGPIPGIGGYIPHPWGNWSSLGNIIIGGVAFGISQFTNLIKNRDFKGFLFTYGMTTLIGGFMNGILTTPALPARAPSFQAALVGQGPGAYVTSDYYPYYTGGTFVRRPQSPARGYGSDVTKNPMAAIPTKIPTNKILA